MEKITLKTKTLKLVNSQLVTELNALCVYKITSRELTKNEFVTFKFHTGKKILTILTNPNELKEITIEYEPIK